MQLKQAAATECLTVYNASIDFYTHLQTNQVQSNSPRKASMTSSPPR